MDVTAFGLRECTTMVIRHQAFAIGHSLPDVLDLGCEDTLAVRLTKHVPTYYHKSYG